MEIKTTELLVILNHFKLLYDICRGKKYKQNAGFVHNPNECKLFSFQEVEILVADTFPCIYKLFVYPTIHVISLYATLTNHTDHHTIKRT